MMRRPLAKTTDPFVSFLLFLNYMKEICTTKLLIIFKLVFPLTYFGFRKGHSTEQCLVIMLEEWKKQLAKTDLSKGFDSLSHDLIIAQLSAYGYDKESLEFIHSYLKERKQRTIVP